MQEIWDVDVLFLYGQVVKGELVICLGHSKYPEKLCGLTITTTAITLNFIMLSNFVIIPLFMGKVYYKNH